MRSIHGWHYAATIRSPAGRPPGAICGGGPDEGENAARRRPRRERCARPPPLQPHQKTVAQHHRHGMPMKPIPAPPLILIPPQLRFRFLMILLHPVPAMGIRDQHGQRRRGREVTPEILPVSLLVRPAVGRSASRRGGCHPHPPASTAGPDIWPGPIPSPPRSTRSRAKRERRAAIEFRKKKVT